MGNKQLLPPGLQYLTQLPAYLPSVYIIARTGPMYNHSKEKGLVSLNG